MNNIENEVLRSIWEDRYRKNNESLEDNYWRVASYVSNSTQEKMDFYNVISEGLFLPAGRTMSNSGIGENLTLNNCFVAPQIPDDLNSIFDSVKLGAVTHKAGGGIGYDFSAIRPAGQPTSNDAIASGPVSFMEVFNTQTSTILQGNRRGANMGALNVYHPDIEDFITAKTKEGKFVHFNLSVMVDDDFIKAAENDEEISLHFPVYDKNGLIIKDPALWKVTKKVNAKELWDKIMKLAYENGEPGIFFYDNMNKDNNLYYTERIVCSNPCAEYLAGTVYGVDNPMEYGGACNLGSLILPNFVINPFTKDAAIDGSKLINAIRVGVRMLDNIIDINKFPDKIYENYQKRFRTIGLGITGLHDALTMLNLKYSSKEGREYVDKLMDDISYYAYEASCNLAKEKGAFPGFSEEIVNSGYLSKQSEDWDYIRDLIKTTGIRNSKILSIAPTGTMSLTFGNNCSSGIEPIFSLEYDRKIKFGGQSEENAKVVTIRDYAYEKWLKFKDDPECVVTKDIFETALNLSVDEHVDMLGVIAKHVDMSVSKTINIPTSYTFEQTKEVYKKCWRLKVKGCTIFRPNEIRQGVLISDSEKEDKNNKAKEKEIEIPWGTVLDTADDLVGYKRKITNGCGKFHLHLYFDENDGSPRETFIDMGRGGGCERNLAFISKLMSICLRAGVPLEEIIDAAKTIRPCKAFCDNKKSSKGTSCPSAIGWALEDLEKKIKAMCFEEEEYEEDSESEEDNNEKISDPIVKSSTVLANTDNSNTGMKCPDCGAKLNAIGGCIVCPQCGWNRCGE